MAFTNRSLVFFKTRLPFYKYLPSIPGTFLPILCPHPVAFFPDLSPLHRASNHNLLLSPFPCYSRFDFLVPFHLRHHFRDFFLIFHFSVSRFLPPPPLLQSIRILTPLRDLIIYSFLGIQIFSLFGKTIFYSFLGIQTFSLFDKKLFYFIHSSAFRIFTLRQKIILLHF